MRVAPRLPGARYQGLLGGVRGQAEHHVPGAGGQARVRARARCVDGRDLVDGTAGVEGACDSVGAIEQGTAVDGKALDDGVGVPRPADEIANSNSN